MLLRILVGSSLGVSLGALLGYFGKCSSGACPLTANPWRGAFFGLIIGLTFAFSSSASGGAASPAAASKVTTIASETDFRTKVESHDGLVLVEFSAPWCGWCRKLEPVVEKLAAEYKGKVRFVKVNTDDQRKLAKRLSVGGLPTMLLFKNGKQVARIVGYRSEEALEKILKKHLGAAK
jgi:thioredoxin 1